MAHPAAVGGLLGGLGGGAAMEGVQSIPLLSALDAPRRYIAEALTGSPSFTQATGTMAALPLDMLLDPLNLIPMGWLGRLGARAGSMFARRAALADDLARARNLHAATELAEQSAMAARSPNRGVGPLVDLTDPQARLGSFAGMGEQSALAARQGAGPFVDLTHDLHAYTGPHARTYNPDVMDLMPGHPNPTLHYYGRMNTDMAQHLNDLQLGATIGPTRWRTNVRADSYLSPDDLNALLRGGATSGPPGGVWRIEGQNPLAGAALEGPSSMITDVPIGSIGRTLPDAAVPGTNQLVSDIVSGYRGLGDVPINQARDLAARAAANIQSNFFGLPAPGLFERSLPHNNPLLASLLGAGLAGTGMGLQAMQSY